MAMLRRASFGRVVGEAGMVATGRILAAGGTLVSVRVLTEILDPVAYGEVALAMTVVLLLQQTWTGPIGQAAMRYYSPALELHRLADHLEGVWQLFRRGLALTSLPLGFVLALALLWGPEIPLLAWASLAISAYVFAAVSGAGAVIDDVQAAARRRKTVAFHQAVASWLRLLGAYAAVRALGSSSTTAMAGMVAAAGVVWTSQFLVYRTSIRGVHGASALADAGVADVGAWRVRLVAYAWPFAAWGLFGWAQMASERWAIATFVSTAELGKYAALSQIGYFPMAFAAQIISQVLAPVLFARCGAGGDRDRVSNSLAEVDWITLATAAGALGAVAVAHSFHAEIAAIMLSAPYRDISPLLPVLVASGGAFAVGQLVALGPLAYGRPGSMLVPKIGSGVSTVGLVLLGAWVAGVTGVAWGGLSGSVIYVIWQFAQVRAMGRRAAVEDGGHA